MADSQDLSAEDRDDLDGLYGATDAVVREVRDALAASNADAIHHLIEPLHAADLADLFEKLSSEERHALVPYVGGDVDPDFFSYLDEKVREDIFDDFDMEQLALVVQELDSDDAVDLIEDLDAEEQAELLQAIPAKDRALFEDALSYPEDSAGRLMNREVATVPSNWLVGQTIDYMRSDAELPTTFYDIYVMGPGHRPIGSMPVSRILRTKRPVPIADFMDTDLKLIPVAMDQENVAFIFRQYGLASAPVVDELGRLVGVITVDDIVSVVEEEHVEDMLNLGGVREDDFYEAVVDTTRSRFSWLLVNLATAILASLVISLFDAAIDKVVALAVLMPIVASMGGNAGTQTLTVAVRALALKELTPANALRIVGKEVLVGGINGIVFAILMGAVGWYWFDSLTIGLILAAAMIINLIMAGFAGTVVPLTLDRMGIDPAIASAVVLTTVTDVIGFLAFLGLASLVLL
ncbi:MAG: magnesium transporter [Pseudomonadota bacterium]